MTTDLVLKKKPKQNTKSQPVPKYRQARHLNWRGNRSLEGFGTTSDFFTRKQLKKIRESPAIDCYKQSRAPALRLLIAHNSVSA